MNNTHPRYKVEQFFAIRIISGLSVSPDGKTVAYITNTNGLPNIWTIPIEGGWTSQITLWDDAVKGLYYSKKKNELIFTSDKQGDENNQLYLISHKGGEVKLLTPEHIGSQVLFTKWDKKGDSIYYNSNKRNPAMFDTYIKNIRTGKEECIYQSENIHTEITVDVGKDERYLLINRFNTNINSDVLLYDKVEKNLVNITEHKGMMKNNAAEFDKDSKTIYFLSDYEREFSAIAYYKIKEKEIGWYVLDKWDIEQYQFSKSEKYLLYCVNENGVSKLKLRNTKSGKTNTLKIPKGTVKDFMFTPDGEKIIILFDTPKNPNDIYVYNIAKKKLKQITFSMIGGIDNEHLSNPHTVKYKSFDGLEINANLWLPKGIKKDGTNPAIVWPHGGPEHQERFLFQRYFHIMNNRGYIVISPSFRGSTGYGKTFQKMIYKDWGGGEFKDVLGAHDYLLNSGYVDKNKISVVGGSFGGFMTLTCVTKAPDLWKCAADIFGPSSLITFQKNVPEHWKPGTAQLVGDPVKDKDFLEERSPINFVDNIKCPLLIIQGANDPRVVQSESDQMVERLRSLGKEVQYQVLTDEGHGFSKVSNSILVWKMITEFLDKHVN